jgi:hypothetical protein
MFTSRARLTLCCLCLFGTSIAVAWFWGTCKSAPVPACLHDTVTNDTVTAELSCSRNKGSSPLSAVDDSDNADNAELVIARVVRRHRTFDRRHQPMETILAGGQSIFLVGAPTDHLPRHDLRPHTTSLKSLQVRLQI